MLLLGFIFVTTHVYKSRRGIEMYKGYIFNDEVFVQGAFHLKRKLIND